MIETTRSLLNSLAADPAVRSLDVAGCKRVIESCYGKQPFLFYSNVGIIDPEGNLTCGAVPASGPVNLSDRHYFQHALETRDFAMGDFQVGRVTGKSTVGFGYPAVDDSGQVPATKSEYRGVGSADPLLRCPSPIDFVRAILGPHRDSAGEEFWLLSCLEELGHGPDA